MKLNPLILATAAVLAGHANGAVIASANFTGLTANNATTVGTSGTPGVNGLTWTRLDPNSTYSTPSVNMQSGTANALRLSTGNSWQGMLGTMASSTTIPVGHTLTLSFIGQYTETPTNIANGLRFGFVSGSMDNAFGMQVGIGTNTSRGILTDSGVDGSPLTGTTTGLTSVAGGTAVAAFSTSVYTASFAITRTDTNTYNYFGDVNGSTLSATGIVGGFDNYNAIVIRNAGTGNSADFQIDNVSVTLVPEPSAALLGGLGLLVLLRRRRA